MSRHVILRASRLRAGTPCVDPSIASKRTLATSSTTPTPTPEHLQYDSAYAAKQAASIRTLRDQDDIRLARAKKCVENFLATAQETTLPNHLADVAAASSVQLNPTIAPYQVHPWHAHREKLAKAVSKAVTQAQKVATHFTDLEQIEYPPTRHTGGGDAWAREIAMMNEAEKKAHLLELGLENEAKRHTVVRRMREGKLFLEGLGLGVPKVKPPVFEEEKKEGGRVGRGEGPEVKAEGGWGGLGRTAKKGGATGEEEAAEEPAKPERSAFVRPASRQVPPPRFTSPRSIKLTPRAETVGIQLGRLLRPLERADDEPSPAAAPAKQASTPTAPAKPASAPTPPAKPSAPKPKPKPSKVADVLLRGTAKPSPPVRPKTLLELQAALDSTHKEAKKRK